MESDATPNLPHVQVSAMGLAIDLNSTEVRPGSSTRKRFKVLVILEKHPAFS